ncbi:F-box domain-containing protein [Favolaschia claudopus]|uniref:F-box domain-containing protein n=1 Tax=Favolaschia claudopus TaxID=2862362 RepID=A0AAW0AMU7_9AGAR
MLDFLEADRIFVAQNEARILDLEAQITALKRSIVLLRASQEAAEQRLSSYKYPALTLPNEISGEIFIHFLPPYPDPPPFVGNLSPMCLTHVCRQWRDIACKTPALWRAIDVNFDHRLPCSSLDETLTLIAKWSARSGHSPLSIRMAYCRQHHSVSMLTPLVPHRARWEHLALRLANTQPLSLIEGSLPLLKTCSLEFDNPSSVSDTEFVPLHDIPLLHTAVLDDCRRPHVSLPWFQLTSLTLNYIYSEHCMSILRQTTCLVNCTLFLSVEYMFPDNEFADLVLPRLESLVLEMESYPDANFFHALISPALVYLKLPECFLVLDSEPDPIASLSSFVSRSQCRLRELHVTETHLHEHAYRDAFPLISNISVEMADSDFESE